MLPSCAGGRLSAQPHIAAAASGSKQNHSHVIRVELDIITTLSSAAGLIGVVLWVLLHFANFNAVAAGVFRQMLIGGRLFGLKWTYFCTYDEAFTLC